MINKKLVIVIIVAAVVILFTAVLILCTYHKAIEEVFEPKTQLSKIKITQGEQQSKPFNNEVKKQQIDLYSSVQYDLPLYSILEISKMPQELKKMVDKIMEDGQGVYLLKYNKRANKVFLIPQNLTEPNEIFARHGLESIELYEKNGKIEQHKVSIGYAGDDGEIVNSISGVNTDEDSWEMDLSSETPRPLKHTRYDSDKNIVFIEHWNYSENIPVKYEMTKANGHPISVYRETLLKDSSCLQEHTFYDDAGKVVTSASAAYDGPNLVRFSYYNSDDKENNVNITEEYANGVRAFEKIYDSNYKLLNSLEAKYNGDKRIDIESSNTIE